MTDLAEYINREKAIDIIRKHWTRHDGDTACQKAIDELRTCEAEKAEPHIAEVNRLNKQVEELQKNVAYWQAQLTKSMCGETLAELEKPRWIPVTERLPEKDVRVIVCASLPEGVHSDFIYEDGHWFVSTGVTHWMPLPEPPKEE